MVNLTGGIVLAAHLQTYHLRELLRERIADDADDTHSTAGNHGEGERVVTGDDIEVAGLVLDDLVDLLEIARSLLDGYDILTVASQTDGGLGLHIDARTTRHVVEHNGQRGGSGNGLEVLVETFLRRLIVVGANAQHTVDALEVARLQLLDDGCGIVATTAHQDGDATANEIDDKLLDFLFLLGRQCGSLARSGENTEKVGSIVELILHQTNQRLIVYRSVFLKRGYQRNS